MQIVTIVNGKLHFSEKQIDNRKFDPLLLSSIPDVNELLQLVSNAVANNVTNEIIVSTDGDLLKGETGSKVRNSQPGSCS